MSGVANASLILLGFEIFVDQLFSSSSRRVSDIFVASKLRKALVERPLNGVLDRLVKETGQEWNNRQSETNRAPCSQSNVLDILHGFSRVLDHAVNGKGWQSHTGHTLEDGSLHHDCSIVLQWRNYTGSKALSLFFGKARESQLARIEQKLRIEDALVAPVRAVSLKRYVSQNIKP